MKGEEFRIYTVETKNCEKFFDNFFKIENTNNEISVMSYSAEKT